MGNEGDIIKNAELRKLQSETARNEAEQKKFLSEVKEIEKRVAQGPFELNSIIKTVIAGIIAAVLLAAWAVGYLKPLLEKNQELSVIENKVLAVENKEQAQLNAESEKDLELLKQSTTQNLHALQTENDNLRIQQSDSKKLIGDLKNRLDHISKDYQKLSIQKLASEEDKAKYAKLAEEANSKSNLLNQEIAKLNIAQQKTEDRSINISDQLISNWLMENNWAVEFNWKDGTKESHRWQFKPKGILMTEISNLRYTWQFND